MICRKCKKTIPDNITICPHCGTFTKSQKTGISNSKVVKNKFIAEDQTNLIGGLTSKDTTSFMSLKKVSKKNNNDLNLKDFNSFIDYKEAKRAAKEQEALSNDFKPSKTQVSSGHGFLSVLKPHFGEGNKEKIKNFKQDISKEMIDKNKTGATKGKKGPSVLTLKKVNQSNKRNDSKLRKITLQKVNLIERDIKPKKRESSIVDILAFSLAIGIWIFVIAFILLNNKKEYYFDTGDDVGAVSSTVDNDLSNLNGVSKSGQSETTTSLGVTSIIYDYQYLQQVNLENIDDVYRLISSDSIKQKTNCPNEIIKIEEEIINNYGITAVNLCEMNADLAEELKNVVKYIFVNYPKARKYLTNMTLGNVEGASYIAAFMPVFTFATSNTNTGYPVAIKTQIILNAKYFLNASKLKNSVTYGAKSGYFPPNASSSSTVAHEFGHYLSYVALLNYYKTDKLNFVTASNSKKLYEVYDDFNQGDFSYKVLQEAYEKYQIKYGNDVSFDGFRGSISTYAMAKNSTGNYIYDETIAEAFHDCYLNGDNAKKASQIILETLLSKL